MSLTALALGLAASLPALPPQAPGELLVVFRAEALERSAAGKQDPRDALHARLGATLISRLAAIHVDHVRLPASADEEAMARAYEADPLVQRAERNHLMEKCAPPNDALYAGGFQSWYDRIAATQAFEAGSAALGLKHQVKLAVLDTGVQPHPEIAGQLLPGASFHPGEPTTEDFDGHGTFIAGQIASLAGNGAGIAGVFFDASKIRILPVKVLGSDGGYESAIVAGILYAVDQGARVLNLSLRGNADTLTLERAVNYARKRGAFLVAAAGNDGGAVAYPAAYPNAFSVGALDQFDQRAAYSNYGRLDLSAPGGDATPPACGCTALPFSCGDEIWSLCTTGGQYAAGAGTSFAAPMVAAAAALLLAQDFSRTPEDLHRILTQSADPLGGGYNAETGWGRLNVYRALTWGGGPPIAVGQVLKAYNWPNPFNPDTEGLTHLTFLLEKPSEVRLRILDLAGDLVWEKRLEAWQTFAGKNIVVWDGRNAAGRIVANGVYFLTVEAGGGAASNRVAVLR